jgi:hypothetical protein
MSAPFDQMILTAELRTLTDVSETVCGLTEIE